ncbi:MAG: glycoside hydrolase family 57 [Deltaproteobacteria bacterium]|nr:MAG: glycoside hydrolase family 57 [Deltaproteobacteria bacterium]
MKETAIAFLWHFHQPYYRHPERGEFVLPWVRLHGVRAYYDLGKVLDDFPGIKMNFNFVPSLLKQLDEYGRDPHERYLRITRKEPSELEEEERLFILENFFSCNFTWMIKPYPGFLRLWNLRRSHEKELGKCIGRFSEQDLLDLQVWFNLTWFGYYAKEEYPELKELIAKDHGFTPSDRDAIVRIQLEVLNKVIPIYQRLLAEERIEITTSGFYHPILPLVYDTDFSRRCQPDVILPERFSCPEDVRAQVGKAARFHEEVWGRRPLGFWPPEGGVCPEILEVLRAEGIEWLATDEGILENSLGSCERGALYRPYQVGRDGEELVMIFRDRGLSDKIGFSYYNISPGEAVDDFLSNVERIAAQSGIERPLLSIILDGENPWVNYEESGAGFLRELLTRLSERNIKTVRVGDFIREKRPSARFESLATGSWINRNFSIWIGHEEDRRGWEALGRVRKFLEQYLREKHRPANYDDLWELFYIAEGSDWFWWWGDEFFSVNALDFDLLFRENLSQIYRSLGEEVPQFLRNPIKQIQAGYDKPKGLVRPVIDGRETSFYEWKDAGLYRSRMHRGSMSLSEIIFEEVYYGFDEVNLYFRIDFNEGLKGGEGRARIRLVIGDGQARVVELYVVDREVTVKGDDSQEVRLHSVKVEEAIEIGIPGDKLGLDLGDEVKFYLELYDDGTLRDRIPYTGEISFLFLGKRIEEEEWVV